MEHNSPFKKEYAVFLNGGLQQLGLRQIVEIGKEQSIWSGRISTGLFGLTSCPSGNRGPKEKTEVLLAAGRQGLTKLIDLGFIPCPACKPEQQEGFWEQTTDSIVAKYGFEPPKLFCDKNVLGFDARRLQFEQIIPVTGGFPGRLYVPPRLTETDVLTLRRRLSAISLPEPSPCLPAVGCYDANAPGRFREYP